MSGKLQVSLFLIKRQNCLSPLTAWYMTLLLIGCSLYAILVCLQVHMNLEEQFILAFSPLYFNYFNSFFNCLSKFQKVFLNLYCHSFQDTGVIYAVKKEKHLPEGTEIATNLTYEYLRLTCSHHQSGLDDEHIAKSQRYSKKLTIQ